MLNFYTGTTVCLHWISPWFLCPPQVPGGCSWRHSSLRLVSLLDGPSWDSFRKAWISSSCDSSFCSILELIDQIRSHICTRQDSSLFITLEKNVFLEYLDYELMNTLWNRPQITISSGCQCGQMGGVSLTFHELSKIFSQNLCITEIVFMRIPSQNFVRVPKAMLWAHTQSFSLKFSLQMWFLALYIFTRLFWRAKH